MHRHNSVLRGAVSVIALAALWLLTHRYRGIWHDGIFYAAQAIFRNNPTAFHDDLFFAFGSQDNFTAFTALYAQAASTLSLGTASLLLLIICQCGWAIGFVMVARRLLRGTFLLAGLALAFSMPRGYGPEHLLSYAETFLTARSAGEVAVLLSIAAAAHSRVPVATVCSFVAILLHPIIGLPGLIWIVAYMISPSAKRRIVGVATLIILVTLILLPRMDTEWLELVRIRSPFLLLTEWNPDALGEALAWLAILAIAAQTESTATRFWRASLVMGLAGMALAAVASIAHTVMLIQVQSWRCLWLVKPLAWLALVWLFQERWHRGAADRWLLIVLSACSITSMAIGGPIALLVAWIESRLWQSGSPPQMGSRPVGYLATAALASVGIGVLLTVAQQIIGAADNMVWVASLPLGSPAGIAAGLTEGPAVLLLMPLAVGLTKLANQSVTVAIAASAVLLSTAIQAWKPPANPVQDLLFAREPTRPFGTSIPPQATVYWQDNFERTWFLLRQGNYASTHQSAGLVFSRDTAMASKDRLARLHEFGSADGEISWKRFASKSTHPPTMADVYRLCRRTPIDYVILGSSPGGIPASTWKDPSSGIIYRLYDCRGLT